MSLRPVTAAVKSGHHTAAKGNVAPQCAATSASTGAASSHSLAHVASNLEPLAFHAIVDAAPDLGGAVSWGQRSVYIRHRGYTCEHDSRLSFSCWQGCLPAP